MKPIKIIVIVIIIGFLVIALNGFLANNLTPHPVEIDRSGLHSSDYPLLSKIQFADYDELVRQCGLYNMPSTRELCYQGLQEDIDRTQLQNALWQLPESKEYSLCLYLWNDLNCLEQVAVKANDPSVCYEILKSPSKNAGEQMIEGKSFLEYRKDACLAQLK